MNTGTSSSQQLQAWASTMQSTGSVHVVASQMNTFNVSSQRFSTTNASISMETVKTIAEMVVKFMSEDDDPEQNPTAQPNVTSATLVPSVSPATAASSAIALAPAADEELAVILKEEIKFGGGSSQILPRPDSSFDTIDKIAKCLIKYPELRLFFDGHTACMPCKGDCEALQLSQDRCDSIEAALRDRNVSNVFTTKGWGCKHPTVGCQKLVRIHVDKEQTASAVQQSTSNALSKASSPAGVQSNAAAAVICPSVNPAAASAAPPDPAVQSKLEAAKKAIAVALSEKIQFYWKGNVGSNIKPESQPIVDKVAAVLMQYPDLAINIQGHTACEHYKRGAPCGLLDLAEERAAAVVAALKQKGCANEFSTKAWGCLHPDVGGQMLVSIFPYSQAQAQAAAAAVQQQTAAAAATAATAPPPPAEPPAPSSSSSTSSSSASSAASFGASSSGSVQASGQLGSGGSGKSGSSGSGSSVSVSIPPSVLKFVNKLSLALPASLKIKCSGSSGGSASAGIEQDRWKALIQFIVAITKLDFKDEKAFLKWFDSARKQTLTSGVSDGDAAKQRGDTAAAKHDTQTALSSYNEALTLFGMLEAFTLDFNFQERMDVAKDIKKDCQQLLLKIKSGVEKKTEAKESVEKKREGCSDAVKFAEAAIEM